MRKRFINQTAITGYSSIAFAFIPFFQGGTPLNLMTWILGGVGVILVLYGAIKAPNRCQTLSELIILVEKRKQYLPEFKSIMTSIITRHDELMNKAGHTSFEEYAKKYFWANRRYRNSLKNNPSNINYAYQVGFFGSGFITDNLLYQDLIKANRDPQIESQYDLIYSQIKDRKLKKLLKNYWDIERGTNSHWIFSELMKNSKQKITINKRRLLQISAKYTSQIKNNALSKVMMFRPTVIIRE